MIRACLEQRSIPVYGDGTNRRDWMYVEDHCDAIVQILRRGAPGETYCLGGMNEWANIDIARQLCKLADGAFPQRQPHEGLIGYVADRPGHDWRYAIRSDKARRELGWAPRESFATGLEKTFQWYVERFQSRRSE